MTRFIEQRRDRFGVELLCRTLGTSPSTHYARRSRPPSARAITDAWLHEEIERVFKENYSVYGARKLWRQLHREGIVIGRDRVARLMRQAGLQGIRRGRRTFTTRRDEKAARPLDRDFTAEAPDRLWLADITYVRTWAGFCYVAFVEDAFSRMIVGWSIATHLRTSLACWVKKLDRCSDLAVRRLADLPPDLPRCSGPSGTGSCAGCSVCSSAAALTSGISRRPCSATS